MSLTFMVPKQAWIHLDRMQRICMARESIITRNEWLNKSLTEQKKYYNWMRQQVHSFYVGPFWE